MAVATDVTDEPEINSVFGVSFPDLEASQSGTQYHNFPIALVDQGFTETVAYSLWLDDLTDNTGSILFSGLDKAKFCGDLTILDIQDYDTFGGFWVALSSVSVTASSGSSTVSSGSALALFDSGTSLTLLPQDVLATVLTSFPSAQYDRRAGYYIVDCTESTQAGHFTFTFGSTSITVGLNEYVLSGEGSCALGFNPSPDANYVLGDTFLRSAYVVYDLVNRKVGVAQSNFNGGSSDIVPFPSYGASIPQATGDTCGSSSTPPSTPTTGAITTTDTGTGSTPVITSTGTESGRHTTILGGGSGTVIPTTVIPLTRTTAESPTSGVSTVIPPTPQISPSSGQPGGSTSLSSSPTSSSVPTGGNSGAASPTTTTSSSPASLVTGGAVALGASPGGVVAVLAVGVALLI